MTLATSINLRVTATLESVLDLAIARVTTDKSYNTKLTTGTGASQANGIFSDTRTLAASATEDLDLAAALVDGLGATITFTKVKAIIVKASAANTNNVIIGAGTNPFLLFSDPTDSIPVCPGGVFVITAPDAAGLAVTAATGDIIKVTNSAGTTGVTYDIIIIGVS